MSVIGFKAIAEIDDGASNAYAPVTGVVVVRLPEEKVGEVERTELNQAARTRKFAPTLIDGGTLKIECNWSSVEYARFRAFARAGTQKNIRITGTELTTAEKFIYPGFVSGISPGSYEKEGSRMFSFDWRVADEPTFTAAT